jgi:hypothetical protein
MTTKFKWLVVCCTLVAFPVAADIRVVYAENPSDELDVHNVKEIKNSYETQISELEVKHSQEKAELRNIGSLELEEEKARSAQVLDEKQKQLEKQRSEIAAFQQKEDERKRKADQLAQVNKDYNLSADLTKKVIRHIGMVPNALPAVSSEGINAPLVAAFNSLMPMEWKVYVHQNISDQAKVSWQAMNENWVATLYKLGVRYNYSFDINWTERWVLVNRSDLALGSSALTNPKIEVMGTQVEPGAEGYMVIDGKIMKVRRSN